jgi:hypothetical protein
LGWYYYKSGRAWQAGARLMCSQARRSQAQWRGVVLPGGGRPGLAASVPRSAPGSVAPDDGQVRRPPRYPCQDKECEHPLCIAWREGYEAGHADGYAAASGDKS